MPCALCLVPCVAVDARTGRNGDNYKSNSYIDGWMDGKADCKRENASGYTLEFW